MIMNKKTFLRLAKEYIVERIKSVDTDYTAWDGFLEDYPEDFDGENTYSILENLLANVEVDVWWDDGEEETRIFPNSRDYDVSEEG